MKNVLTRYDVRAMTGMGNSTLERKMAEEGFPKPGKDGKWSRADIEAWNRRNDPPSDVAQPEETDDADDPLLEDTVPVKEGEEAASRKRRRGSWNTH